LASSKAPNRRGANSFARLMGKPQRIAGDQRLGEAASRHKAHERLV
jgi:hypothetical protein